MLERQPAPPLLPGLAFAPLLLGPDSLRDHVPPAAPMPVFGVLSDRDGGRDYMATVLLIVMVAHAFHGQEFGRMARAYLRAGFAASAGG